MYRHILLLEFSVFLSVFLVDKVQSASNQFDYGESHSGSDQACSYMNCNQGEDCISRKFWCKNPPCPSMLYCSKSQRESLKGPITCDSVRCSKGYVCLVTVRRCRWDQRCKQRIARCVSEYEYYDSPASCADFRCPSGHRCILRESLCTHPPCKLLRSCAKMKDIEIWHDRCRTLGCPSEYECFLRRPPNNCSFSRSCKHTADCTLTNVNEDMMNPDCRGWVCPRNQTCSAIVQESCNPNDGIERCHVTRVCNESLVTSKTTSSSYMPFLSLASTTDTNILSGRSQTENRKLTIAEVVNKTLTQVEKLDVTVPEQINVQREKQDNLTKESHRHQQQLHPRSHSHNQPTAPVLNSSHTELISNRTDDWGIRLDKTNSQNNGIYRTPIYVRYGVVKNSTEVREEPRRDQHNRSITEWLDYLRLKTGVDAIDAWARHAEEDKEYEDFKQWLSSVKISLGPMFYDIWLQEILKLMSKDPDLQKWLAENEGSSLVFGGLTGELQTDDVELQTTTKTPEDYYRILISDDVSSHSKPPNNEDRKSKDGQTIPVIDPTHNFQNESIRVLRPRIWQGEKHNILHNVRHKQDHDKVPEEQDVYFRGGFTRSQHPGTTEIITTTVTPKVLEQDYHRRVLTNDTQFDAYPEMDFYAPMRPGNDGLIFLTKEHSSNHSLKKNAGHPRINYGQAPRNVYQPDHGNRRLKDFVPVDLKNKTHDKDQNATLEPRRIIENNQNQEHPPNLLTPPNENVGNDSRLHSSARHSPSLYENNQNLPTFNYRPIKTSNQDADGVGNSSALESPHNSEAQLQKNLSTDSGFQDTVSTPMQDVARDDSASRDVVTSDESHKLHDSTNENNNAQDSHGVGNALLEAGNQYRNRTGHDPDVSAEKSDDPERNSNARTTSTTMEPGHSGQQEERGSPRALEFPESFPPPYYDDPEGPDVNLFAPVADELHIPTLLDVLQVSGPNSRTYYAFMGFPPKQVNNRVQIIGYPLIVSPGLTVDPSNVFPQNVVHSREFLQKSSPTTEHRDVNSGDPRDQVFHQVVQNSEQPAGSESNRTVNPRNHHRQEVGEGETEYQHQYPTTEVVEFQRDPIMTKHQSQPTSAYPQNWYPWHNVTPQLSSGISMFPTIWNSTDQLGAKENLTDHRGTLSTQDYVDSYVDAFIEDAFSQVIIATRTNLEVLGSQVLEDGTDQIWNYDDYYDHVPEKQTPDSLQRSNLPQEGSGNVFESSNSYGETMSSTKNVLMSQSRNQTIDTGNVKIDDQNGCKHKKMNQSVTTNPGETITPIEDAYSLDLENDEMEDYYYENDNQPEYKEDSFGYQGMDATDYDSLQYYDDEEYDEIVPKNSDDVKN